MSSENIIVIPARSTNPPARCTSFADANKQIMTCFAAGPFPQGLEFRTDIKEREGSG
jgi:hypothetical protein